MQTLKEFLETDFELNENLSRKSVNIINIARMIVDKIDNNESKIIEILKEMSMSLSNAVITKVTTELSKL